MSKFGPVQPSYPARILAFAATVLIAIAALVIFGRMAGYPQLARLSETGVPMAFVTALGLLVAGLAFAGYATGRKTTGSALSGSLVVGSLCTLFLYAFADPLHLGAPFIYNPQIVSRGIGFDGRMSPNTAICFVLLG